MGYITSEESSAIKEWRLDERRVKAPHRLRRGGIPAQYRLPLREVKPFDYQEDVYGRLSGYLSGFRESWSMGKGLMLVGPSGRGKTLLACALGASLVLDEDYVVAFTTLNDYVQGKQALIGATKLLNDNTFLGAEAREEYGALKHKHWIYKYGAYLLILDDVGKEYRAASGWAAGEFEALLRDRYYFGLPTIITTNLPPNLWDKEYSDSMQSFVEEACPAVSLG